MTSNSQVKAVRSTTRDRSLWQWPIDLIRYDRTPELSAIEHEALIALGWDLRRGRCHDPSRPEWATIKRLLDPLDDACHNLFIPDNRYHRRCALDAIALILMDLAERDSPSGHGVRQPGSKCSAQINAPSSKPSPAGSMAQSAPT